MEIIYIWAYLPSRFQSDFSQASKYLPHEAPGFRRWDRRSQKRTQYLMRQWLSFFPADLSRTKVFVGTCIVVHHVIDSRVDLDKCAWRMMQGNGGGTETKRGSRGGTSAGRTRMTVCVIISRATRLPGLHCDLSTWYTMLHWWKMPTERLKRGGGVASPWLCNQRHIVGLMRPWQWNGLHPTAWRIEH